MRNISIKGVAFGTLLTLMLDAVAGMAMLFLMGQGTFQPGMTEAEATSAIKAITRGTDFLIVSLVAGTLTTVAGGYVAARVAKRLPYLNAAASGVVGLVLGAVLADGEFPLWFNALGFAAILPGALVGGFLVKQHARGAIA